MIHTSNPRGLGEGKHHKWRVPGFGSTHEREGCRWKILLCQRKNLLGLRQGGEHIPVALRRGDELHS